MAELNENVVNAMNEIEVLDADVIDFEKNGTSMKAIIVAGVVVAVVSAAGIIYKKLNVSDKIMERRIRKLEKKGYVVFKKEELETSDYEEDSDEDTEE